MTPKEWVDERAERWAEWRIRTKERAAYYGDSCLADLAVRRNGNTEPGSWRWLVYDDDACLLFESAVNSLADPLRVIFHMHWFGSDVWMLPASGPIAEKAGRCGVSVRQYHRLLERAREELYAELH